MSKPYFTSLCFCTCFRDRTCLSTYSNVPKAEPYEHPYVLLRVSAHKKVHVYLHVILLIKRFTA